MDLTMQIREQEARLAPYAAAFKRVAPEAKRALEDHFRALVQAREAQRQRRAEYERLGMEPLHRTLAASAEYRQGLDLFVKDAEQSILTLKKTGAPKQSPLAARLAVQPLGGGRIGGPVLEEEDKTIDFYAPPYADQETAMEGSPSPHQQQETVADKSNGTIAFAHTIGNEGGWAHSMAAVWVEFVSRRPSSFHSQIQVRPYVPYSFHYRDRSYVATAHNDGGFGIYVLSWDFNGNDQTLEQDYRYSTWSDGTSWYEDHSNSSDSYAFPYGGQEVPYFNARPGRIYRAAIWCFGSCDAHGTSVTSASYAQARIQASVPFVVIGQT